MLKDLEQKSLMKGKDLAENFAQWFDELYLGKYDLVPFFKVNKISDNEFDTFKEKRCRCCGDKTQ